METNTHDLVETYPCDSDSKSCMYGEFSECSNIGGFEEDDEDGTERESDGKGSETDDSTSGKRNSSISFQHWCRQDKRVTKALSLIHI